MRIRNLLLSATLLCLCSLVAIADETPKSAHANIINAEGTKIGTAYITPTPDGVSWSCRQESTAFIFTTLESARCLGSPQQVDISIPPMHITEPTILRIRILTWVIYQT